MITSAQAKRYGTDPINFLEERYILPDTRKPIRIEPWQKEYILKPLFYDLDERGYRKYDTALISMPKKNGKSAFGAGLGVNALYCWEQFGEIVVAANAKDQASMIIYNKMKRSIAMEPDLKRAAIIRKEQIEIKSTGSTARCVANQYETAAGLNPNFTIFDELWGFTDRKFFDELTLVPTRANPLIVIVTYAGFNEEGLLWDIYTDGLEGEDIVDTGDPEIMVKRGKKDDRLFMFWSHKNLASWVTDEYLEKKRRNMPPDVYARLHENRWVGAGSQFITKEDIDAVHDRPWLRQTAPQSQHQYIVATDLGLSHDRTARAVLHFDKDDGNVYIDDMRIWQGTPEKHVDIGEVEEDLIWCAETWHPQTLVIDPWQMEYVIQRLSKVYNVKSFSFNKDIFHLSQVFISILRQARLKCYFEPELDKELRQTIIKQTASGWRIDHPGRKKNDILITIGMGLLEAVRHLFGQLEPDDDFFNTPPIGSGLLRKEY